MITLKNNSRVWFITGASSGFGKALANAVLERGEIVVATARNRDCLSPLIKNNERSMALSLEVSDIEQCNNAVDKTISTFGHIDILINNAGHGMLGAIEEVSDAEVKATFDTNVFGLLNVTKAVLPNMRQRRSGYIVNIGSVAGLVARAGLGIYCATKFAIEGISEALHNEVISLGIKVMVVEPGPFRTDFLGRSLRQSVSIITDYDTTAGEWRRNQLKLHGLQEGDPDKAVRVIMNAINSPAPPFHLVLGTQAMGRASKKCLSLLLDIENWREVSATTNFDQ
ncbi:MAG: SDR family NAD(P)-dependent oxidoreductase [Rhodospirillaceae bacterium]|jgi:NADP-dependent 3-hydroxy acid dehydrogenase YdfG|nr:SDR family NAD(P)-dependent oxidoreductase [Rhodospirillaceae bacterium]